MNPIYDVGERVVFAIARDIEVMVIQRRKLDRGFYDYQVAWMHNGDRKEAWVGACELDRRNHSEEAASHGFTKTEALSHA